MKKMILKSLAIFYDEIKVLVVNKIQLVTITATHAII